MKQILIAAACLLATSATALAQDEHPSVIYHTDDYVGSEVMIGHGFLPSAQVFNVSNRANNYHRYNSENYTGAIFGSYRYHISHVISLGLTAVFNHESGTVTDNYQTYLPYSSYLYNYTTFKRSSFTVAPEITFTYGNFGHGLVRMYSVVGMGYTYRNETVKDMNTGVELTSDVKPLRFNAYVSPLGIRFGRQLSGFFEFGLGYKGVFNYGLSYRF